MLSLDFSRHGIRAMGIAALMLAALLPCPMAHAQADLQVRGVPSPDSDVPLQFSGDAASIPTGTPSFHILRANNEAGRQAPLDWPLPQSKPNAAARHTPLAGLPRPGFFPADLSNLGGLVLLSGGSINIYYNCADESCWGDPEGFLTNLSVSNFIHIVDQYTGSKAKKRYPLSGTTLAVPGSTTFVSAATIQGFVDAAAQQFGPHVFHVFLPQGVETCLDSSNTACYSPSGALPFVFCAYHSTVNFNDGLGNLIYTVEPFQDVNGCVLTQPPNGYPNGELADSTNSTLSHELFELITDPFGSLPGGSAWRAISSQLEDGEEIGDICHGPGDGAGGTIVPTYTLVKGRTYQTQLEYSNARHGCVASP